MWLGWVLIGLTFRVFPMSFSKALMACLIQNMIDRTRDEEWSEDIEDKAREQWKEFVNSVPVAVYGNKEKSSGKATKT